MRSHSTERGIAMITTLLVLMLISALLVGFTTVVMSDQRFRFIDRDRGQAFYAASGGIEKLTADLGNLFLSNIAPTSAQASAIVATTSVPTVTGVNFISAQAPQPLPGSSLNACAGQTTEDRRWQRLYADVLPGCLGQSDEYSLGQPDLGWPVLGVDRASDALSDRRHHEDEHGRRSASGSHDRGRGDSGVPVRHLLGRGSAERFFAGADFKLRRARSHATATCFSPQGGGTLTALEQVTAPSKRSFASGCKRAASRSIRRLLTAATVNLCWHPRRPRSGCTGRQDRRGASSTASANDDGYSVVPPVSERSDVAQRLAQLVCWQLDPQRPHRREGAEPAAADRRWNQSRPGFSRPPVEVRPANQRRPLQRAAVQQGECPDSVVVQRSGHHTPADGDRHGADPAGRGL